MFDINILISEVNVLQIERVMYGSALNVIANQGHFYFSQMLHSTKAFKIISKNENESFLCSMLFFKLGIFLFTQLLWRVSQEITSAISTNLKTCFSKLRKVFQFSLSEKSYNAFLQPNL